MRTGLLEGMQKRKSMYYMGAGLCRNCNHLSWCEFRQLVCLFFLSHILFVLDKLQMI